MRVWVGCCGYGRIKGGMEAYFRLFNVVEVQRTFYELPRMETARSWLERAKSVNPDFVFTMKAWQAISHPPSSPTWRRARSRPKPGYGWLRASEDNLEAWRRIYEVARALDARVVVVQTPASFGYSEENARNVEEFFSVVERKGVEVGWEPRGSWRLATEVVKRLVDSLDLIHVVDPFRWSSQSSHQVRYYRLHGIGGRETNYRYRYTASDLERLLEVVLSDLGEDREVYVMFNNIWMVEDASAFRRLLRDRGISAF